MAPASSRARRRAASTILALTTAALTGWPASTSAGQSPQPVDPQIVVDRPPVLHGRVSGEPLAQQRAVAPTVPDVMRLHSRLGSPHTMFLDFDGTDLSGSRWAELDNAPASPVVPGADLDSRPGVDVVELAIREMIWRHVAEDFAPFDVDVTTEQPPAGALTRSSESDQTFGTAVVFAPDNWIREWCQGCTGTASVGIFATPGADRWREALVFPDYATKRVVGTLDYATIARFVGSTASHELGHHLGLQHDGVTADSPRGAAPYSAGRRPWGPIMGASAYPLTRWADGSAPFSDNPEDDLAEIAGILGLVPDELPLLPLLAGSTATGTISQAEDSDTYRVVALTDLTVTAQPAGPYADLDLAIEVTDASGRQTLVAPPARMVRGQLTGLGATVTLRAGSVYRVVVQSDVTPGVGSYGSLGRYSLSLW